MKALRALLAIGLLAILPAAALAQVTAPTTLSTLDSACGATTSCVTYAMLGNALNVDVTVTGTITLTFSESVDDTTYRSVLMTNLATGAQATTTTASGTFNVAMSGFQRLRVTVTAVTGGTAVVRAARGFLSAKSNSLVSPSFSSPTITGQAFAPVTANCSAPSYSYTGDTNTGTTSASADVLSMCAGGSAIVDYQTTQAIVNVANLRIRNNGTPEFSLGTTSADNVRLRQLATGVLQLLNSAQDGWTRLVLGANAADGTGISLVKTGGGNMEVMTGTGSADTSVIAANFQGSGATPFSVGSVYAVSSAGLLTKYANTTTAGYGVPAIVATARATAQVAVNASVATYTPAADGTFEVSCNVNVTTSTTHSFSCDVTYTDENNNALTMILPMQQLAGSFVTGGLITNVTGTGPYESPVMHIRAKASTAITVRTSAGGTYTTVTYNVGGVIKQIAS